VSDEQVATLIEMAMYAPNRLNRQPWRFLVLRDPSLKKELADLLRVRRYLEQAAAVIAVCGLPSVSPTWVEDLAAAIENMLLAATALDLGGAWIGALDTVMWGLAEKRLHEKVHIPEDVRVAALVAIGHPSETPSPHSRDDRFDLTKVHFGEWGHQPHI
jgi:nitroreductase